MGLRGVRSQREQEKYRVCLTCTLPSDACDKGGSSCPFICRFGDSYPATLVQEKCGVPARSENYHHDEIDRAATRLLRRMNGGRRRPPVWARLSEGEA